MFLYKENNKIQIEKYLNGKNFEYLLMINLKGTKIERFDFYTGRLN